MVFSRESYSSSWSLDWSGKRPIQWLYDNCTVDERWCLVHATHSDQDEVALMANSRAIAGLCRKTEANLGDGIFPAVEYHEAGGQFGIGSDSHVSLSVVEELRWLEYGQRLRDQRRNRLYGPQSKNIAGTIFTGALRGGSQALGQRIGKIEAESRADWVVLDGKDPYIATAADESVLNRWIFAGSDRQISDVMVKGKWVIRDGHHALEQAYAEAFADVLNTLL